MLPLLQAFWDVYAMTFTDYLRRPSLSNTAAYRVLWQVVCLVGTPVMFETADLIETRIRETFI